MISLLLYYVILLNISFYFLLFILFICFPIIFLCNAENPTLEDHSNRSTNNVSTPIYPQKIQVPLSEKKLLPKHLSKLVSKNTLLNLNITSSFLNILASPDVSTWFTTGGPINKTIKYLGLTRHHQKTLYRNLHMVHMCKEMEQESTRNNCTRHLGQPYLLSNWDEISILHCICKNTYFIPI